MAPLFDLIVRHVPAPQVSAEGPFSMLVTTLERDPYLGRVLTGRIETVTVRMNIAVKALGQDGRVIEQSRITTLLSFRGIQRVAIEESQAGDIIAIPGLPTAPVATTLSLPYLPH